MNPHREKPTVHHFRNYRKLIRPYQYTKNLFVFLPAFFAFQLDRLSLAGEIMLAFVAFSLTASAVYVLNDWLDRFEDARHPEKKYRPIASGVISKGHAFLLMGVLLIAGTVLAGLLSVSVLILISGYFVLNALYSIRLKHLPIVDISLIGIGFVLRLMVGAEVADVPLSPWIIMITFLLALFLSLAKRRDDVLLFRDNDKNIRPSVDGYNLKFVDSAMVMTASIVVLAYILWTLSTEIAEELDENRLYLTSVFVILGMMRYMYITFVLEKSGNPSLILLQDRFLQATLAGWLACLIWILYL